MRYLLCRSVSYLKSSWGSFVAYMHRNIMRELQKTPLLAHGIGTSKGDYHITSIEINTI
jgi:hypothetical protein